MMTLKEKAANMVVELADEVCDNSICGYFNLDKECEEAYEFVLNTMLNGVENIEILIDNVVFVKHEIKGHFYYVKHASMVDAVVEVLEKVLEEEKNNA